jgi:hypothetical protein
VNFLRSLQNRWKVDSIGKVVLILLVFCLTGTTVVYLKKYVKPYLGDEWYIDFIYYILILPFYNIILLVYGFLLGQGLYFLDFEKRFFSRIFKRKN